MKAFANLLDRLAFTPQRNGKLTLVRDFLREQTDPGAGLGPGVAHRRAVI